MVPRILVVLATALMLGLAHAQEGYDIPDYNENNHYDYNRNNNNYNNNNYNNNNDNGYFYQRYFYPTRWNGRGPYLPRPGPYYWYRYY